MPKPLSKFSIQLLEFLNAPEGKLLHEVYEAHTHAESKKKVYDSLFRLTQQTLVAQVGERYKTTEEGLQVIHTFKRERDGIWKIIIFDIPESRRAVRTVLRSKLASLGFQKWQNSIWITPYAIPQHIEEELNQLATKFFIRLIKTTDINMTDDLEEMFVNNAK